MTIIGIVGSEGAKFTPQGEQKARQLIRDIIQRYTGVQCGYPDNGALIRPFIVSGQCHLGGIDIWAVEEAVALQCEYKEFPPKSHEWTRGYKPRNELIAGYSTKVYCVTVKQLPPGYVAKGFEHYCYHCKTNSHIKSGGCWTTKYAREMLHKETETIVIDQEEK